MVVETLEVHAFRCIREAHLNLHPQINLLTGENASGKTSLLEALFFLGRGRSFRASQASALIRQGDSAFRIVARLTPAAGAHRIGLEYSRQGFRIRVDGEDCRRLTDLAAYVPASIVDAEVHALVQGSPGTRRRFLDWGLFHVEPSFLEQWRRYQRLLQQRNALLRSGESRGSLDVWTADLAAAGEALGLLRERYVESLRDPVRGLGRRLLQEEVDCRYRRGWDGQRSLEEALVGTIDRDRQLGATQVGPHRADLEISVNGRPARDTVSRGQQKVLAAALLLAQVELYAVRREAPVLLMLDDPAAELDRQFLDRLLAEAMALPVQLVVTALQEEGLPLERPHERFHVKQGNWAVSGSS